MLVHAPATSTKSLVPHRSMSRKGLPLHDHQTVGRTGRHSSPRHSHFIGGGQSTAGEGSRRPQKPADQNLLVGQNLHRQTFPKLPRAHKG